MMHNGTRIAYGSYGTEDTEYVMRMLAANRGVHEPQEEKIFQQVLPLMPAGAVMLELGAYWGFYSLWFTRAVAGARCFLVEPTWSNLNAGRLNFSLNGAPRRLSLTPGSARARSASRAKRRRFPWISFCKSTGSSACTFCIATSRASNWKCCGVQPALLIAAPSISSSFPRTRMGCITSAAPGCDNGTGRVIADANLDESYSADGLIVAHRPDLSVPAFQPISRRTSS